MLWTQESLAMGVLKAFILNFLSSGNNASNDTEISLSPPSTHSIWSHSHILSLLIPTQNVHHTLCHFPLSRPIPVPASSAPILSATSSPLCFVAFLAFPIPPGSAFPHLPPMCLCPVTLMVVIGGYCCCLHLHWIGSCPPSTLLTGLAVPRAARDLPAVSQMGRQTPSEEQPHTSLAASAGACYTGTVFPSSARPLLSLFSCLYAADHRRKLDLRT
ncbi:unnamed protein product [Lepidochelys kempii]